MSSEKGCAAKGESDELEHRHVSIFTEFRNWLIVKKLARIFLNILMGSGWRLARHCHSLAERFSGRKEERDPRSSAEETKITRNLSVRAFSARTVLSKSSRQVNARLKSNN